MFPAPIIYEVIYQLGELELAEKVFGEDAVQRVAEMLTVRGHTVEIRDPHGRIFTLDQFRAQLADPPSGPLPEEILTGARRAG